MSLIATVKLLATMTFPYLFTPDGMAHAAYVQRLNTEAVITMETTDQLKLHQALKSVFELSNDSDRIEAFKILQTAGTCNDLKGRLYTSHRSEDAVSRVIDTLPEGRRCEEAFAVFRHAMNIPFNCISNSTDSNCEAWR